MQINTKRYPLLSRIVFYAFLFASLASVLVLSVQLYMAYSHEKRDIIESLDRLETSQLDTLINNVWNLERLAVKIQLQSVLEDPDIVYIWIQFDPLVDERMVFGAEPPPGKNVISKDYDLLKSVDGEDLLIGRVGFVATTDNIAAGLLQRTSKTLSAELLTIGVTCLFMLVLFIYLYSRHINRIVLYTEALDIGQLDQELVLQRKKSGTHSDEIDQIVDALNSMRIRVKNEIHAQYLGEKQLSQEKMFSDTIINSLPGIFFVLSQQRKVVRYNRLYLDFFRLTDGDVYDHDFTISVVDEHREDISRAIDTLFYGGETILQEMNVVGGDGKVTPFLLTAHVLKLGETQYMVAIGTDLTAQKRMESQFRQAQKMEALGILAGGISHDFNNILTAIVGYTNLARIESEGNSKLESYLATVADASDRARALVQQILSFSRKTESGQRPLQVAHIVREAMQLLRSSLPSTIKIEQNINSDLQIIGDSTEIHQVVMNLCTNAYHAMQDSGGVLSVRLYEYVGWLQENLPDSNMVPGVYLVLEIKDTGQGIDEKIRSKVFEPYFTTKDAGVGTGLGLAVVHGIVSKHKGYIHLESQPQVGTTFSVYLPAVLTSEVNSEKEVLPAKVSIPYGKGEHILVVDDEPVILELYEDILKRYGYTVTCFTDSLQSLEAFHENGENYDLAILDQMMPNMKGDMLAEKMWITCPRLPVILCSGFSGTLGRYEFIKKGFADYIQKPVSGTLLLETIRDVLTR